MRNRLVLAFVGLTVAILALYAVPRAFYINARVHNNQQALVDRAADYAGAVIDRAHAQGHPVDASLLSGTMGNGERLEYVSTIGARIVIPEGASVQDGDLTSSTRLRDGSQIAVRLSEDVVHESVRSALTPLVLLGLGLVPLSALAGWLLARRLSRPFSELATVAEELGTGRLDVHVPDYRIPEAHAIGQALAESAERLDALRRREREVAVHASHQLRTPITALRITLEDLALWPQTSPEVAEELHRILQDVDRFSDAVTDLLESSREQRMQEAEDVRVDQLLEQVVERWTPVAEAVGLHVAAERCASVTTRLPRVAVRRALDLVFQHACEVAIDGISVDCRQEHTHVAVGVRFLARHADDRASTAQVTLAEAIEAAAALGGRLATEERCGAMLLVLMLPLPRAEDWMGDPTADDDAAGAPDERAQGHHSRRRGRWRRHRPARRAGGLHRVGAS